MKSLISLILILVSFYASAQKTPFVPYYNLGEPWQFQQLDFFGDNQNKIQDSLIELHQVKTRKQFSKNKKGQTVMTDKKIYNGKESQFELYSLRSRKVNNKSYYKINNYRIYQWKTWGAEQKQINEYESINGKEFLKEKTYFTRNKPKGRSQYFWNINGVLDSMYYFKKREVEPNRTIHYFYKNEKLAETKTFEKGKLTAIRKYDCTPLGAVQKKVKQTKNCVNTEFDAQGNKITVSEFTDEKGRTRKWKTTYIGKSDVVLRNEGFDFKNRPTYFDEKTAEKHIYINYSNGVFRKGKESFKKVRYFDKNKNVIKSESFNNGKLRATRVYSFDSNNQLTSQINLNKKGEEFYRINFDYNSKGLKTKQTRKGKKKTFTSTFAYEY